MNENQIKMFAKYMGFLGFAKGTLPLVPFAGDRGGKPNEQQIDAARQILEAADFSQAIDMLEDLEEAQTVWEQAGNNSQSQKNMEFLRDIAFQIRAVAANAGWPRFPGQRLQVHNFRTGTHTVIVGVPHECQDGPGRPWTEVKWPW